MIELTSTCFALVVFQAMALAASRSNDSTTIEPFVLRTYDYPYDNAGDPLVSSSATLTAAQATAATTALPLVVHSVKAQLKDKDVSFMDGGLYGNCPLHVAIDEARQLFPRRPLGVVLSIGFNDVEDALRDRVIQVARSVNPDLHFHRLAPSHITAEFKMTETNLKNVVEMEEKVNDFILTDHEVSSALDSTMKKLVHSNQSSPTPEYVRRQAMLKNESFHGRTNSRQQLKELFKKKSSQSKSISNTISTISSSNHTNRFLSISSSTKDLHTINLNNEIFIEEEAISAAVESDSHSFCCGNRGGWAVCIPSFALCSGCIVTPDNTSEVEDSNLEVKSISMNRVEVHQSNDDRSVWSA